MKPWRYAVPAISREHLALPEPTTGWTAVTAKAGTSRFTVLVGDLTIGRRANRNASVSLAKEIVLRDISWLVTVRCRSSPRALRRPRERIELESSGANAGREPARSE